LVFKAAWVFIPLVAFAGYAFTKTEAGTWIAWVSSLPVCIGTHKANIRRELKDYSRPDLVERVQKLELDLYHAKDGITSRDSLLNGYREMEPDDDLQAEVLAEIASALQVYDQDTEPDICSRILRVAEKGPDETWQRLLSGLKGATPG